MPYGTCYANAMETKLVDRDVGEEQVPLDPLLENELMALMKEGSILQ